MLVVCTETEDAFNLKEVKERKFLVVQKLHAFQAFKELQAEGVFSTLTGHKDGFVTCYVVKPGLKWFRLVDSFHSPFE